jgi:hypothetical protein
MHSALMTLVSEENTVRAITCNSILFRRHCIPTVPLPATAYCSDGTPFPQCHYLQQHTVQTALHSHSAITCNSILFRRHCIPTVPLPEQHPVQRALHSHSAMTCNSTLFRRHSIPTVPLPATAHCSEGTPFPQCHYL